MVVECAIRDGNTYWQPEARGAWLVRLRAREGSLLVLKGEVGLVSKTTDGVSYAVDAVGRAGTWRQVEWGQR